MFDSSISLCCTSRSIHRYHDWIRYKSFWFKKDKIRCFRCGEKGTEENIKADIAHRKACYGVFKC